MLRGHADVVGVAEAADVVADDRTDLAGGVEHARPPGVARDRRVEPLVEGFDGADDTVELLFLTHLGPRPGLDAADVEQVGALVDEHLGPAEQRVELVGEPGVVERVGRAVEDPHHERAIGEVVHLVTESVPPAVTHRVGL